MILQADWFRYRCDWRSRSSRPGNHRSALTGSGFEMRENALLQLGEDPRRIDLRRSARDPLQRLWVRRMVHRSTTTVHMLADLSDSMVRSGERSRYETVLQFAVTAARSASINGDKFALAAADTRHLSDLSLRPARRAEFPAELLQRLQQHSPDGAGCEGILAAAKAIGPRRCLVFVVSDFYWPLPLVGALCKALSHVQLVPVMLCKQADLQQQSSLIAVYADAETGQRRLSLALPWQRQKPTVAEHRQAVEDEFMRHSRRLLRLEDGFDANSVSAYFYR